MRRLRLPSWLRRGIEGALIGGGLALVSLLGAGLGAGGAGGPVVVVPAGIAGAVLLAPAVLGIGAVATCYPIAMAATRGDALLGSVAAFLLAADAAVIVASGRVTLERSTATLGAGLLVAMLALVPGVIGLVGGQVATPLGFGRRAGAIAGGVAVVAGLVVLALLAAIG